MLSHYNGDWFNWLAKCWVTVTCPRTRCKVCKKDAFQCWYVKPQDLHHMVESEIMTRTSER